MGRRRKQKVQKRPRKTLPKVFTCPECGKITITVEVQKENKIAYLKCGNCKLEARVIATHLTEPVDAYGEFLDKYYEEYA
ncbi:MAG: hypothetical protein ACTSPY_02785 [Candidatus Helarchaeota archaeon]